MSISLQIKLVVNASDIAQRTARTKLEYALPAQIGLPLAILDSGENKCYLLTATQHTNLKVSQINRESTNKLLYLDRNQIVQLKNYQSSKQNIFSFTFARNVRKNYCVLYFELKLISMNVSESMYVLSMTFPVSNLEVQ